MNHGPRHYEHRYFSVHMRFHRRHLCHGSLVTTRFFGYHPHRKRILYIYIYIHMSSCRLYVVYDGLFASRSHQSAHTEIPCWSWCDILWPSCYGNWTPAPSIEVQPPARGAMADMRHIGEVGLNLLNILWNSKQNHLLKPKLFFISKRCKQPVPNSAGLNMHPLAVKVRNAWSPQAFLF